MIGTDENRDSEDIQISGGGAYVLNPGQGGTFENGQFIADILSVSGKYNHQTIPALF